jgi:hypothetical protein
MQIRGDRFSSRTVDRLRYVFPISSRAHVQYFWGLILMARLKKILTMAPSITDYKQARWRARQMTATAALSRRQDHSIAL